MKRTILHLYQFLPVQLFLLHLRKSQLLLIFWVILFLTVTKNFATAFGASTLFLAPEYLGEVNISSMFLLGIGMGIYVMSWNITTFIMHSHRIPFMGGTHHAFLKYCYNNSLLPLLFFIAYTISAVQYQWEEQGYSVIKIISLQFIFYFGYIITLAFSFLYFFRVDRDLLKSALANLTNPSVVREIIPYDELDREYTRVLPAKTFLNRPFKLLPISALKPFSPRVLNVVLRRHHRNAIFASLVTIVLLIVLGAFAHNPWLRLPAGAGFLILFSVLIGVIGSVKYFLRTWELIGWIMIFIFLGWLVRMDMLDIRSRAFGLQYDQVNKPAYNYKALKELFSEERFQQDKQNMEELLRNRLNYTFKDSSTKKPLVIISVSGGGSRAAYYTFRVLQYADSITQGKLYQNTILITGASGGMIGATYWRAVHSQYQAPEVYHPRFQHNIGKDLLNAIVFSMATVDAISPLNKINIEGYRYGRDRGYAMEEELIRNTEGLLRGTIGDYHLDEKEGKMPAIIYCSTILNDSRKLLISPQSLTHLCQPSFTLSTEENPPIDAVDFNTFFSANQPHKLRLATALRMNATFPIVLPVVKLPSEPEMNMMDAGMRDNFGIDLALRFLQIHQQWLSKKSEKVILFQIRDTRAHEVFPATDQSTLQRIIFQPITVMSEKWEPFQSYAQDQLKDMAKAAFGDQLQIITLEYVPQNKDKVVALNFHLTPREKNDLLQSIYLPRTQENLYLLKGLLKD